LGINYMTVQDDEANRIDWRWLMSLPVREESQFVARVFLESALTLKVDGRRSQGVLICGV
jgi:hypothetical protein